MTWVSGMGKGRVCGKVSRLDASVGMASCEFHGVRIWFSGGLDEASSLKGKRE